MHNLCFLFNHDQTHQIAHGLPIALDLIGRGAAKVTIAVTSELLEREIRRLAGDRLAGARLIRLGPTSWTSRTIARTLDKLVPARKLLVYRDNLSFFKSFDALVVSEKSSLQLKTRYGLKDLQIIHTRHGAGDRAIGFSPESALFDLVLVAGPKIRDRLIKDAGVSPDKIRVTGYVKFDMFGLEKRQLEFEDPTRKTVWYNPHPSPRLSSWYTMGESVLEQLYLSDKYNVVFAPHIMLFERSITVTVDPISIARAKRPDHRYSKARHMMIDLGSSKSSDMTYSLGADLYLGDVSSQVYEFLAIPRPCLFLNAHHVDWKNDPNYSHWQAGDVIESSENIVAAIDHAFQRQAEYMPVQQRMLQETFSVTSEPASRRSADAILQYLSERPPTK